MNLSYGPSDATLRRIEVAEHRAAKLRSARNAAIRADNAKLNDAVARYTNSMDDTRPVMG